MKAISVVRAVQSGQFYVYTYSYPVCYEHIYRAKNDRVFYVGKGVHARIFHHIQEARTACTCRKCRTIRWIWRDGEQVDLGIRFITKDEREAYIEEDRLIKHIGFAQLVNYDQGGRKPILSARIPKSYARDPKADIISQLKTSPYICKGLVKRVLDEILFRPEPDR